MFAIAGVTGKTGAATAEALLARGKAVRVVVRDAAKGAAWQERGCEVAVADLWDVAALTAALTGVEGAYLLCPPLFGSADPIGESKEMARGLASAAAAAKVPHVVFLSSIGAEQAAGTGIVLGLHGAEKVWSESGVPVTLLRPAYFLENWGSNIAPGKSEGVFPTFIRADLRLPMIASKDVGEAAAEALIAATPGSLDLAGPVDPNPAEVAMALGNALGRELKVAEVPTEQVVPVFGGFGIPEPMAAAYQGLYEGINGGRLRPTSPPRRGRTTAEQVFREMLKS